MDSPGDVPYDHSHAIAGTWEVTLDDETYDGPPGVPHYPDPTKIDDGEFWAPGPQPGPDYWALRRNDRNLCSAQRRDGQPGMFGLGRCTLGFGHNGAHGDLIDRLGGEALQTRIVQALLLAEGAAPSPSGLPSWQTNDREDAEAIAATVVRALIADAAGVGS